MPKITRKTTKELRKALNDRVIKNVTYEKKNQVLVIELDNKKHFIISTTVFAMAGEKI